jgi:hypothetical protein
MGRGKQQCESTVPVPRVLPMGVKGLLTLAQSFPSCWVSVPLSGGHVVIDGNAFAMHAYYTDLDHGGAAKRWDWKVGGDYVKFAAHLTDFLARLHDCSVVITVVFDGYEPWNCGVLSGR